MGDPAGIGPEVCVKAIRNPEVLAVCRPVLFGDAQVLVRAIETNAKSGTERQESFDLTPSVVSQKQFNELGDQFDKASFEFMIVDFGNSVDDFPIAKVSAVAGKAAYQYIDAAIAAAQMKKTDAVVTGPINKLSLHAAGFDFPGHTELLAQKTATKDFCMLQYSSVVSCSFATTHCGYVDVTKQLSPERILTVIRLTNDVLTTINGRPAKLLVCGLNPHAGEQGLFGEKEEEQIIAPAIQQARDAGLDVTGPLPPDTCFIPKMRESFDCVICMYHDQGHIPLKALAFDQAVNTTLGLPIIRTSVDHGTAFDIVGTGQADPSSLIQAIKLAAKLCVQPQAS